ncbi:MAG: gliding motility lipoprotein GldD [Bacteroidales bacterium]
MNDPGRYRRGWLLLLLAGLLACDPYTPKPTGYLRVDYPEKTYHLYDEQAHFQFEVPDYADLHPHQSRGAEEGWLDVDFSGLQATLHLSYKEVDGNLDDYIADSRALAYKHTVKAAGIDESPFLDPVDRRFGMVYDLKGDVASAVQFFLTDSTRHFLRGSLYFDCAPNRDSLNPVIRFLREDIVHLIETTQWKY